MLRDIPEIITNLLVGIVIVLILIFYFSTSFRQESTVQLMNEVIRTSAVSNIDHSSRVEEGQLYISKEDFENDVINQLANNDTIHTTSETKYVFDYLENTVGAIKSIRLNLNHEGKDYQSTVIVEIVEDN